MAQEAEDWVPRSEDIAYWRFLKSTGMQAMAWLCLQEGTASMWARPREDWMRQVFLQKHAGHEHVWVGEVLDRYLQASH